MNKRVIWYLLLAVILLAALFRFWRLGSLPPGLYHDEAYNGLDALSLNQGKIFPQFYEGWELYAEDAHGGQPAQETRYLFWGQLLLPFALFPLQRASWQS